LSFAAWFSASASALGGKAPVDWVAADQPDEDLADAYAEVTGLRLAALEKSFPALKSINPDQLLIRFLGLETMAQFNKGLVTTKALVASPSMQAVLKAAEDMQRVHSPALVSALQAAAAVRPALEAALTLSPSTLDAMAAIQRAAVPYAEIASIQANLKVAALAGINWNVVRPAALEGLMAVRPLLANLELQNLGLLSSSLWAEAALAPAVGSVLEQSAGLAELVRAESATFARWLSQVDLRLAEPGLASAVALGITTHIRSRATVATLAPAWRQRDDADVIEAVVEVSAHFELPLDLELPGTGRTLREVMERRLPRTLEAFRGLAAVLNATEMPNRAKYASFAFRDALRTFYEEITGEKAANKADRLRALLAAQVQNKDSGPYLLSSIQLLEDLYKPVGAAVYGRGGDRASFTLWTYSAVGAMGAIITSWIEDNPT
jgi:hypothetical protein